MTSQSDPTSAYTPTEIILGIDLGTTNSLVAVADATGPRVLTTEGGDPIVPSVVRYERADGRVRTVVGADARDRAPEYPRTTVTSSKRLMGRSIADCATDAPYLGYEIVAGEHDTARIALPLDGPLGGHDNEPTVVSPQEVAAAILGELKRRAESVLGQPVSKAVVTVPAYFDDTQRQATRDAGRIAGLEVVRIVNEPTAAALAYGLGSDREAARNAGTRHVAVYDLGGGTFDISILRITPTVGDAGEGTAFYQVLSTAGDTRLGGDDIDHAIVELVTSEIGVKLDSTEALPVESRRAIAAFARAIKHRLSDEDSAQIRIELGNGDAYERTITRDELEAMMSPMIDRTIAACERSLRDAARSLDGEPIDAVVMVGGSTRIPLVRTRVGDFFGLQPYTALDPDTVVALGAAVQGSILAGAHRGSLLLDVIPLSLGIETQGGAVAKLIMRNSPVPARATEMFSTSVDGQVSIKLNVLQGEREMAENCRSLGEFHLTGLPPMPAGIPQLEVEFIVDANGVLDVRATEKRSGKRAGIQIVPNHGLTEGEVERIEAEAFANAREDMTRHRIADLIVNTKLDLKWIGERFEKYGEKLGDVDRAVLSDAIERARALVGRAEAEWSSVAPDALHDAKESLDRLSVPLQEIGIAESLRADADRKAEADREA